MRVSTQSSSVRTTFRAGRALALAAAAALATGAWAAAPPAIDAYGADPLAARPGDPVTVTVDAHDPDCGPLPTACSTGCGQLVRASRTRWTVSGGTIVSTANGTNGSPYRATLNWLAPLTPGSYTISVSLSDNSADFGCSGTTQTTVETLSIQISDPPNLPPQISVLSAQPPVLFPGESSTLTCAATDPEGGEVSYAWTTDFGTISGGTAGQATLTSSTPGLAAVTCRATDPDGGLATRTVRVSFSGASAERRVITGLSEPHRLAIGKLGELFVSDAGAGGVRVFHLANGAPSHLIPLPGVSAVASDWQGRLIVGHRDGKVTVVDRAGTYLDSFPDAGELGEVADLAVDPVRQRIAVLHRPTGRVIVYDAGLTELFAFGSTGDAPDAFLSPGGVAFTPDGRIAVADGGHGQIKLFDASGATLLLTFGGSGSALGKFTALDDVAVDADGLFYASDPYQSRVQVFHADGTAREALGTWGGELGRFKTPTGLAVAFERLVVASTNSPSLEVFRLDAAAPPVPLPRTESVSASPTALAFGETEVGSSSASQRVELRNGSAAPLGVRGLRLQGDFTVASLCPLMLDPGASCAVEVRFAPGLAGARAGRLDLDTSDGVVRSVTLTGTGSVTADTLLSPGVVAFGSSAIGTVSAPAQVLLINPGTAPLALAAIRTEGDFALTHACPATLPARGICPLTVIFTPTGPGERRGQVLVDSSSPRSPVVAVLSGRGTGAALRIDPLALDFGLVRIGETSPLRFVELANAGADAITLAGLALAGERPDDFLLADDTCSARAIAPGASCHFAVIFQPTTGGPVSGAVEVRAADGSASATLALAGRGEEVTLIEIPTLSELGLALLALLVAAAGIATLRGRSAG